MKMIFALLVLSLSFTVFASERDLDKAQTIEKQPDGNYLVTCTSGQTETVSSQDILSNNICPTIKFDPKRQDILFVVDNSGSMYNWQERLANHSSLMIEKLKLRGIDYRLAVTSTSEIKFYKGYHAPSGIKIIEPQTPNASSVLADNLLLGDQGAGVEKHFSSALAFLNTERNFLRMNSKLHLVFFSNEDDQSPLATASFIDRLKNITKSTDMEKFQFTNIQILDEACFKAILAGSQWPLPKFGELQNLPNSKNISICDEVYDLF